MALAAESTGVLWNTRKMAGVPCRIVCFLYTLTWRLSLGVAGEVSHIWELLNQRDGQVVDLAFTNLGVSNLDQALFPIRCWPYDFWEPSHLSSNWHPTLGSFFHLFCVESWCVSDQQDLLDTCWPSGFGENAQIIWHTKCLSSLRWQENSACRLAKLLSRTYILIKRVKRKTKVSDNIVVVVGFVILCD